MLFISNEQNKRLISYKKKNNKLINIYKYIYCDELIETKEELTNKYIFDILKNLKTNYRLKFDSFLNYELKINDFNDLIICGKGKNFNINYINIVVSSEEIKKTKWDFQNGNLIIPLWQKGLLETYSEKKQISKK